MELGKHFN